MPTFFDRARVRDSLPTFRDLAADLPASIDHAGFEALHGWRTGYEKLGGSVDFDLSHPAWQRPGASAA
jgi:hypothetical protein